MNIQLKNLLPYLLLPLAVGAVSALFTANAMESFSEITKPPFSPPGWIFPVVWTLLYLLMGVASYLVASSSKNSGVALFFYFAQLFFNFLWPIWFFNCGWYLFAFLWLVALWILIRCTILLFWQIDNTAAILLLPYLLWVTFAGYLNLGIFLLN